MSIRDRVGRLTGRASGEGSSRKSANSPDSSGEQARELALYTYLLRVAPPEVVEQVHREAFAALPLEQRERLLLRLRHDLPEAVRPASSEPAELARTAVAAHHDDHGYLVRLLRRPGQGVSEGHTVPTQSTAAGGLLFAGSVLEPVAATAVRSAAATGSLVGFGNSPEAAQLEASIFVRSPGALGHSAWEAGAGGVAGDSGGAG
ncbi:hypothetical protein [Terrabacter sp. 2RAF25]|uniref:hypothetical protein n=1 Tax=Terrabacter sp. 2RAF25 TaxID=3232998 RepID=UPI003F98949C